MSSLDEALAVGRFGGTVIAGLALAWWLPWYLGPRVGLVAPWRVVAIVALLAVEVVISLVVNHLSIRRAEARWIVSERCRAGAERALTLGDIRARHQ